MPDNNGISGEQKYLGGEPQSEIHQFLCDASDSLRACENRPVALALDLGVELSTNFKYVSEKHSDKHVVFQVEGSSFSDESPGWSVGFDREGNKYHGYIEDISKGMVEDSFTVKEIRSLNEKAPSVPDILEELKNRKLSYSLNRQTESDGIIRYYTFNDSERSLVAEFSNSGAAKNFCEKDLCTDWNPGGSVTVIPLYPRILEETYERLIPMEKEIMSTQNKEQSAESTKEKPRNFFAQKVADQLADQLRDGKAPIQRDTVQNAPYNPCTGRSYHGINSLNLMMQNKRDDRWMSFDDAKNAGYKIKAGEKATPVQFWAKKKDGEEKQKMQTTYLFNADQLQFIPPQQKKPDRPDAYERVTEILKNSGTTVIHDQKEQAFYNSRNDEIHLPKPDTYKNLDNYCQDALNAYFHSTGHPSRQDRETFDSPKQYQQNTEELICAVSTTMMCAELGIPSDATKNAELATAWADNIEKYPIQFSQAMQAADDAVWRTMRQEQMRNIELNPQNNEAWRPVAEASPAIAVKTLLEQREILALADNQPEKVNAFDHDGKEVFTKPGTGYILSKTEVDTPNIDGTTFNMKVKTEGYDRDGQTYDVIMEATIRKNESGLVETVAPPEAKSINISTRDMALPLDWNGSIAVSPCHEDESGTLIRGRSDEYPEFYAAFAERENGEDMLLASFDREKQAQYYASLVEKQMNYQQERPQQQQQQQATQPAPEKGQEATADQQNSQVKPPPQEPESEQRQADAREAEQQERSATQQEQEAQSEREQVEEIAPEHEEPEREQPAPEQDKEKARQEAKEKVAERLTEESQDADKAAKRIKAMIAKKFTKPQEPTPYMEKKGVDLIPGTYQNGKTTCVPLFNKDGEIRSMAYMGEDGSKRFAKGAERKGCSFYDKKAVEKSNVVGFAVGVATAATISQTFKGVPVVATMDAANIPVVTAAFKEKYPDKQQVIFANNNLAYEAENGRNPGQYYAKQAAQKTGAAIVSPRFAADEKSKAFVDFNDLATKSKYGKEAVKEQCESAIEKAKEMAAEKAREQKQEKERGNKELARG